ncbi:unnamed protein product [Fraxinus pennsylvanica]|uniref:Uncharacterized protein n=1 Tax=Fraxinus pennsylvanica TaxID=56036 RepID=A0AAD2DK38_9LAMI|nr:unnamed protein product [Fraxinus pennsylvanica]
MFCLSSKLKLALKEFSKEHFLNLPTRVAHARTDLEHVQCLIQHSPLDSSLHREEARLRKGILLSRLAKVADIVEGDTWRWPLARSPTLSDLMRDTLDTFQPYSTREDVLLWVDDAHGVFSVRSAWESIRLRCPRVTWYHIIWFPQCIPRRAFIL